MLAVILHCSDVMSFRTTSNIFYFFFAIKSIKKLFFRTFFPDKNVMDFFDRVKTLARAKKITIESVVNTAGLTIDSYNSYRRHGNLPRADEAVKIAQTLDTTVEFLVTGSNSSKEAVQEKEKEELEQAFAEIDKIRKILWKNSPPYSTN